MRKLKIKYTDHVSNDLVLAYMKTERTLLETCQVRKMKYFGHFVREGGLLANICLGKIEGRRARGRQRIQWAEDIRKRAGTTKIGDVVRLAHNRKEWRAMTANPHPLGTAH